MNPSHLWLCHLKVHHDEMGPVELFDWTAAEALRVPLVRDDDDGQDGSQDGGEGKEGQEGQGGEKVVERERRYHDLAHLLHMPTHLDIQVGDTVRLYIL